MNEETSTQLSQLNTIWELVEQDATFFLQIVPGILPIAARSELVIRQWVAKFFALLFTTPNLSIDNKEKLGLQCLETLVNYVQFEDIILLKNIIQSCSALYPIIFRYTCMEQNITVWNQMTHIKTRILQLWESKHKGIRISCIKFVQNIIQTQTLGTKDPRLINKSDISLNLIPPKHPFLHSIDLEAEAKGFLDRLIENIYEKPLDPFIISATLNCLTVLAKNRLDTNTKIINGILGFNPIDDTIKAPDDIKMQIQIRSLIKNITIVLTNLLRNNSAGSLASKISQYLSTQEKFDMQDDISRKRFFSDITHFSVKRVKIENLNPQENIEINHNSSIISLFALSQIKKDNPLLSIDITQLPHELVARIVIENLLYVKHDHFERCINILRSRLLEHSQQIASKIEDNKSSKEALANITDIEEDDFELSEASIYQSNKNVSKIRDLQVKQEKNYQEKGIKAISFELPDQQPLTPSLITKHFHNVMDRLFLNAFKNTTSDDQKPARILDIETLKTSKWNKQSWIRLISRLCTRGLVTSNDIHKNNYKDQASFSHFVRNKLLEYVLSYFKERIQFAVTWLSEEWYNDNLMLRKSKEECLTWEGPQYEKWTLMVLDGVLPFVDGSNKAFLRFLSDLPELSETCIHRLRILCLDPDRSKLGFAALQYLIMLRPPVRSICLNFIQKLSSENHSDLIIPIERILTKYRPYLNSSQPLQIPINSNSSINHSSTSFNISPSEITFTQ
ncbi:hypothetical protein T552_01267 [Pneumocystis carinii B80]|uniref:Symplekin/Pta1 N-terminal domain-containing protein n=1 Tax=Pneumocystis carinii (strain B80) TaxID=1408658 RepID=A0A0W4ZLS7_PNEC8|nr:hypothetical protein T552_01267 [Pneumocystis carinii B80]KTW29312.1 hypothetical protein T552_01267 [Pneumocystis carinii B80]